MSVKPVKVVILGDASVGKSSLIQRYILGRNELQTSTLGAVFVQLKHIFTNEEGLTINLPIQYWDTAGQERYNSLIPMYVRNSDLIIIAFDLANKHTFLNLTKWLKLDTFNLNKCKYVLVGCKNDIEYKNEPSNIEINKFIKQNIPGSKFFKTSAINGENVNELFNFIKNEFEEQVVYKKLEQVKSNNLEYESFNQPNNIRNNCCF